MSFISFSFLILFGVVFFGYYVLPQKHRWILLLVASYVFYAYFNFLLVFLILFTTLVSYFAGIMVEKTQSKKTKKLVTGLTVAICLTVLAIFKYFDFLTSSVVSIMGLFGLEIESFALNLILPVGISFYTFQTFAYVIDVSRGKVKAEHHFGYYALFVSFFPQLVAGPIERPGNLIPQLKTEQKFSWDNVTQGFSIALAGFVKKVVIADTLSIFVTSVFNAPDLTAINGLAILVASMMFLVQVYCDFSGYSDIAIGCAKMLGIDLMKNFDAPFLAQSIADFWKKWHISLSSWFNDYVYMPLAYKSIGKKHLQLRYSLNIMLVMFLSGLWHGANWTYVLWGLVLGVYQIVEGFLKKPMDNYFKTRNKNVWWRKAYRIARTFLLVTLTMVFFRANSVGDALHLYANLFSKWSFSAEYFVAFWNDLSLTANYAIIVVLLFVLLHFVDTKISIPRAKQAFGEATVQRSSTVYLMWLVVLAGVFLLATGNGTSFIYFQF